MTYGIYFDSSTPAEALRQALHTVYNITPELVYIGPYERLSSHPGPQPVALITPADGPFGHELSAGEKLQELTRATPLELAQAVCRIARTRALLDEGSPAPDYWFLVAADGSFGRVMTDPDNDDLTILYALEPIPGEPGLKVVPPPDWAKTW
ncbi:hypothetical protein [Paractinoplanes brasiliensis]|uniref:Uncharacterized protein n=1 Tax=Paractinoplanes brasiliensis TaxID=52695 RepID=A0A4R6JY62_9ACTN|nr:hypothetical protein [Actinoplanes brasiliensis]TDO39685.1 hypothetical protein C8E87_3381 [Actinoplanes brasiliensis]GID28977.1 hypothetical protein Abr02nite_39600 [Actinoplanes brasiliensis]